MSSSSRTTLLAVEDDPVLGNHLKQSLEMRGFGVTLAREGPQGLALAQAARFDLILLDVLLPGLDGFELLRRLRVEQRTPVIMTSALGDEPHRIRGFDSGADDYLPKPFSIQELQVRIEAILRRIDYERGGAPIGKPEGSAAFDDERCDLRCNGRWTGLTPTEYRLLKLFHAHLGEVLSKPLLYRQILRRGYSPHDRALDMHVSNIRRKLARASAHGLSLRAVWGQGYLLQRENDLQGEDG